MNWQESEQYSTAQELWQEAASAVGWSIDCNKNRLVFIVVPFWMRGWKQQAKAFYSLGPVTVTAKTVGGHYVRDRQMDFLIKRGATARHRKYSGPNFN